MIIKLFLTVTLLIFLHWSVFCPISLWRWIRTLCPVNGYQATKQLYYSAFPVIHGKRWKTRKAGRKGFRFKKRSWCWIWVGFKLWWRNTDGGGEQHSEEKCQLNNTAYLNDVYLVIRHTYKLSVMKYKESEWYWIDGFLDSMEFPEQLIEVSTFR